MLKIILFTALIVTVFSSIIASAQDVSWLEKLEKIKPLESNENDVERILGKARKRYGSIGEYLIQDGRVTVVT